MASTDIKSDAFCTYNDATKTFFWVMEPGQYENTFASGEVGIAATGGTGGSYVRPDVIDIDSFLSWRDDILSKCNPPIPSLDEINEQKLHYQKPEKRDLLPRYTREKKSAIDLAAVDYNRWTPQYIKPQLLRYVVEDMWAQRGGLDTQNYTKLAWNKGDLCKTLLPPSRACGEYCEPVSGFPGNNFNTGEKKSAIFHTIPRNKQEPDYPFTGPYSQQVHSTGASPCGDNFFYNENYDAGNCPPAKQEVLLNNGQ